MLRQPQEIPVAKLAAQPHQQLLQQRRQLRRIVRHARAQPRCFAAAGQNGDEGLVGGGVEAVLRDDGGEEGGAG